MLAWLQKLLGRSDIWIDGVLYMRRWKFMPEWLPGFRLHNIVKSDQDRELHDHPFSFLSIVLRGGYFEYRNDGSKKWYGPGSVLWRPGKTLHRLELAEEFNVVEVNTNHMKLERPEVSAWTFVLRTRQYRRWGFMTENGWVPWEDFVSNKVVVRPAQPKNEFACKSST